MRKTAQDQLTAMQAASKGNSADGKAAYRQAVDEYRKGLWQQARADFNSAQQLGYNGGFFEASPGEYLQKMDEGESKYQNKSSADGKAAYDLCEMNIAMAIGRARGRISRSAEPGISAELFGRVVAGGLSGADGRPGFGAGVC